MTFVEIFEPNQIKKNPLRGINALIVGLLPLVCIFSFNSVWPTDSNDGANVVGRPPSVIFALAWISITLILLFSVILGSMRYKLLPLIVQSILVMAFTAISVLWLYFNNEGNQDAVANQLLGGLVLTAFLLWTLSLTATCDTKTAQVKFILAHLSAIPAVWSLSATNLGYLKSNI